MKVTFPVGFHPFHKDDGMNFQLNRFYTSGVLSYFNRIKQYNTRDISKLIQQDTLVMAGTHDFYTIYLKDQVEALTNARSVESRLFTEQEQAHQHCQVGNTKLALDVMLDWMERVEKNA